LWRTARCGTDSTVQITQTHNSVDAHSIMTIRIHVYTDTPVPNTKLDDANPYLSHCFQDRVHIKLGTLTFCLPVLGPGAEEQPKLYLDSLALEVSRSHKHTAGRTALYE